MSSAVRFSLFPTYAMQQTVLYLQGTEEARNVPVICILWEKNLSWQKDANKKRTCESRLSNQPRIVIVFGRPGAGKETFGQMLTGFVSYSLPARFRELVNEGKIDQNYRSKIVNRQPIPLSLIHEIVKTDLCNLLREGKRIVMDGFPRGKKSIQFFDSLMRKNGLEENDLVAVYLNVIPEIASERASARLICEKCMQVYNSKLSPPDACCDIPLKPLPQGRQEEFAEKFALALEHYKSRLLEIDGNQSSEAMMTRFQQHLDASRAPSKDTPETSRKKARTDTQSLSLHYSLTP